MSVPKEEALRQFEAQVRRLFPAAREAKLVRGVIVIDKRATFSPAPDVNVFVRNTARHRRVCNGSFWPAITPAPIGPPPWRAPSAAAIWPPRPLAPQMPRARPADRVARTPHGPHALTHEQFYFYPASSQNNAVDRHVSPARKVFTMKRKATFGTFTFLGLLSAAGLSATFAATPPQTTPSAPAPARPTTREMNGIVLVPTLEKPRTARKLEEKDFSGYMLVYFKDQTHSAYLAVSPDGYTFTDINGGKPIFDGSALAEQKGVRDPYICRGPDGTSTSP